MLSNFQYKIAQAHTLYHLVRQCFPFRVPPSSFHCFLAANCKGPFMPQSCLESTDSSVLAVLANVVTTCFLP